MESLRDKLKRYLEMKFIIDKAANDVVYGNETIENAEQKYKIDVDKVYKGLSIMYRKKVNILKIKKIHNDNKRKMLEALKYLHNTEGASPDDEIKERFKLAINENLNDEYEKYKKSPESYIYDKITLNGEYNIGVFTFVEEDLLLQKLCNFNKIIHKHKIEKGCCCWYCALERLSFIAYKFALQKNKELPKSWDDVHRKVDENWLYEFEMRHSKELSDNFNSECLWKSRSLSISYREDILEPSIFDIQLQRDSDSSNISDIAMRSYRRKTLKRTLSIWKRIDSAVAEVLDGKREENVVAREFSEQDKTYFKAKMDMIEKKNQYIKEREGLKKTFQKFVFTRKQLLKFGVTEEDIYISKIAKKCDVDENLAVKEYHNDKESILTDNYDYDRVILDMGTNLLIKQVYLTYTEEFDLLKQLCEKKEEKLELCKCQTCASELIITLAEEYNQNELEYSNLWVNEKDKLLWLYFFILRHSNTIFQTFPEDDCEIDTVFEMVRSELQSSSPYIKKEPKLISTSSSSLKKMLASVQIFTDKTRQKYMNGRNTLNFFDWHERLHRTAEEISSQGSEMTNENRTAIAKKYKLNFIDNCKSINEKIKILNKRNKYLETKGKVEKALEAVFNGKMSPDEAAKDNQISLDVLNEEIKKCEELKNKKQKYKYDEPTSDDNSIFTFIQESSFLEALISKKRKKPFDCWCYPCSMTVLYNIALMELIGKEKYTYPSSWEIVEAREMWWLVFHMRHSRKISEFFLPSCTNPNVLKHSSLPSEEETSRPSPKRRRTV